MGSPIIALRFRDTTPGIDTIKEHNQLIKKFGACWWGWWKKDFENDHSQFFEAYSEDTAQTALLVDRSAVRTYAATFDMALSIIKSRPDAELVPTYYRNKIDEIPGWLRITSIVEIDFSADVARRLGDGTIIILNDQTNKNEPIIRKIKSKKKSVLLHLSDIHFGNDYAYLPQGERQKIGTDTVTLTESLKRDLTRIGLEDSVAGILVTGDFITQGNWTDKVRKQALDEFEALRHVFKIDQEQIIPLPGNHDVVRYQNGEADEDIDIAAMSIDNQTHYRHETNYRTFIDELIGRDWKNPLNFNSIFEFDNVDVQICALNSCRIVATKWTEYGYVGPGGIDVLRELAEIPLKNPTFKMMAMHHHLLPVARVEAPNSSGVSLSLDASELLDAAQAAGIQIAVHGHQHKPRIATYKTLLGNHAGGTAPIVVVSNGSSGALHNRLPGNERNTYCLFKFERHEAHLGMRELRTDGQEGASLYDAPIGVTPIQPH